MKFTKEQVKYLQDNLKWLCNPSVDRYLAYLPTEEDKMTARELVDLIFPEHGRTSCSDQLLYNKIYDGSENVRCSRCALLSIINDKKLAELIDREGNSFLSLDFKKDKKGERIK